MSESKTEASVSPVEIRAPKGARTLMIEWSDHSHTRHRHLVLRGFCPCAHCQGHHGPIEWVADLEGEGLELAELSEVGNYALSLVWADGHQTGIYSFAYLRALSALSDLDLSELRGKRLLR